MRQFRMMGATLLLLPLLVGGAAERPAPPSFDPLQEVAAVASPASMPAPPSRYAGLERAALLDLADAFPPDLTCLAQAVYFEARGEPVKGQFAVADVVLNRVADPRYPSSICDVVFQNEGWLHRCQFSFACDGRSDQPRDTKAWLAARTVATLAATQTNRNTAGAATHYHAVYVRPDWASRLERTAKLGRHIFYRAAY